MGELEHTDRILSARRGDWLLVCESVSAVDQVAGGSVRYPPGAKLRVQRTDDFGVTCWDESARYVWFPRDRVTALELAPLAPQ